METIQLAIPAWVLEHRRFWAGHLAQAQQRLGDLNEFVNQSFQQWVEGKIAAAVSEFSIAVEGSGTRLWRYTSDFDRDRELPNFIAETEAARQWVPIAEEDISMAQVRLFGVRYDLDPLRYLRATGLPGDEEWILTDKGDGWKQYRVVQPE